MSKIEISELGGQRVQSRITEKAIRKIAKRLEISDWTVKIYRMPLSLPEISASHDKSLGEKVVVIGFSNERWIDTATLAHELAHVVIKIYGLAFEAGEVEEEAFADFLGRLALLGLNLPEFAHLPLILGQLFYFIQI